MYVGTARDRLVLLGTNWYCQGQIGTAGDRMVLLGPLEEELCACSVPCRSVGCSAQLQLCHAEYCQALGFCCVGCALHTKQGVLPLCEKD